MNKDMIKMKFLIPLATVAVSLTLAGCSSMFNSSVQRVEFITQDITGADCRAKNHNYAYNIYTPDVVTVERSLRPLTVTCRKKGYKTKIIEVPVKVNPTTYWNVWNGVIPGTAYDLGARTISKYPDTVIIQMEPLEENLTRGENIVPAFQEGPPVIAAPPGEVYIEPADKKVEQSLSGRK